MSLTKIKSGVIFKEHQDPTEKEGESMISKSFQILIPPDTDIVLRAGSVEDMHAWLNVLQKESLSKEDLQAISDENGFQLMAKNANFIPKPFTLKFLSCEDVGVSADINEKHKKVMEDENCVYDCFNYDENQGYFGVYDGHGGRMAVEFIKENLHNYVYQAMQTIPNTLEALKSAYLEADKHLCLQLKNTKNKKEEDAGCTASSVILKWEESGHFMHCANIGDSRIVLNRGGKPERISVDHRAEKEKKKKKS